MSISRDNHFVPQFYLKNFANDSGMVCEYRTLVPHANVQPWKSVNVAGTGYEKDLYTQIVAGEEADDIEQWLSREFESPASDSVRKVIDGQELLKEDWEILVRFLASQIVRTPAFLIRSLPIWNQMTPTVLDKTLRDVEHRFQEAKRLGQNVVLDHKSSKNYFPMRIDRTPLPEDNKVRFDVKVVVGRGMWFHTIRHTLTKTLNVLHKHRWAILEAPNKLDWFTSDDPVICLNYRSDFDYDFGGGWDRKAGNILFPLSPNHLMITEIGAGFYPRQTPSRYHARLFRKFIAEHAHRRIYSVNQDKKIPQLKPRIVDGRAFRNERALWRSWYEDQSRAEQEI